MSKTVYFDNNATTQVAPEVREAMLPFFGELYGNPSSMHAFGGQVAKHLDRAREEVARFLNADPDEVIFTSCATESDNSAVRGTADFFGKELKVITAQDLSLRTGVELVAPCIKDGAVVADPAADILKLVVYNRYSESKPQVAFIKGFRLECGAMASTIAHDSHNIVAIGTEDGEIVKVINRLVELKGGIVISDGTQTKEIALPIAGLMSPVDGEEMAKKYAELKAQAQKQGCPFNAPFMTMAFMALPVIPDIKLTDKGLFDAVAFQFTPLMQ